MGLHPPATMSLEAVEAARSADALFAEEYTALPGNIPETERCVGRSITLLGREEVEAEETLIRAARSGTAAFLVYGEPMAATTHISLRLRAAREAVPSRTIHSSSVFSAVPSLLGLQHYKFGRTTTLPHPGRGPVPESPGEVLRENRARGLHTLVLLDTEPVGGTAMAAGDGAAMLLRMEKREGTGAFGPDSLVCVVSRAGRPDCAVWGGRAADAAKRDFGPPPHAIVVPGELHFIEAEALEAFAGVPGELLPKPGKPR